jgi:hypothetical protein
LGSEASLGGRAAGGRGAPCGLGGRRECGPRPGDGDGPRASDVVAAVKKGNGKAVLKTVNGKDITVTLDGSKVKITDAKGRSAYVTNADLDASNGVIHVIDTVLLPK